MTHEYSEGIIINADYGRGILYGYDGLSIVLQIQCFDWGVANMYFCTEKSINALFDDFRYYNEDISSVKISDMVHKIIYMPPTEGTLVPIGLSFHHPELSNYFNGFIENDNGRFRS